MPYIPFTEEQKMTANSVNLPDFLRMRGEKIERAGREFKLVYSDGSGRHDSITMSGARWFDHKNQVGGGAIKFVQYFYNMDFQTAVQTLLGYSVEPQQRSPPKNYEKTEEKRDFRLPQANSDMHRVYAYLIKQRFINPEIISYFAKNRTLYEEAQYHNAVFVGLDENGVPRQAHKRSTTTLRKSFRMTCEGSDTKYSFSYFGKSEKMFVFEAPIDMLSFLTLYPQNWQKHSYIALNGVYENAMLRALETHKNLSEVILCLDNDEGGIEAVDRLSDILREKNYRNIARISPKMKDWNEVLKAQNGVEALPAVPHKRKECYRFFAENLQKINCPPEKVVRQIDTTFINRQYNYLAEYALAGSAFFLHESGFNATFEQLRAKLAKEYKSYTDKGSSAQKSSLLSDKMREVKQDFRQSARTTEQSVQTAKLLYQLADCAVRMTVDGHLKICENSEKIEENSQQETVLFGLSLPP
ncbi:MAG: DUF3991 and toprim domain-containing protein [Ruminococcus flavefaciens]|nr:DUF3991 and toprim domain-containing protein [Ruminococcus flavefaciens]